MKNLSNFVKLNPDYFYLKYLICLIPLFFCLIVYFTGNLNFGGIFETTKYTIIAESWLGIVEDKIPPSRLPGYPFFIYIVFKIFGSNNLTALLFIQALFGCATFFFILKILEQLKIKNNLIILFSIALNFAILFRFSTFLPNFLFIFLLTVSIFYLTKFNFEKKLIYFFLFIFFFSLLFLVRPILQYSIFITYPLIIFYLFSIKKFKFKYLCSCILILFYILSVGFQYLRSYTYDKSMIYTSQGGVHLFWVLSCLKKKYACGSMDMNTYNTLEDRFQKKSLSSENLNMEKRDQIRFEIGKDYFINEMDKNYFMLSALISYLKLIFHSTLIEIYGAFNINVPFLYEPANEDILNKYSTIFFNSFSNPLNAIWVLSICFIFFLRILQAYGSYCLFKSKELRFYGLIISSIILIILFMGIGLGNPRYRSEAEPLLLILSAVAINQILYGKK